MSRIQTARLENLIRRWASIKGPGSVLSETLGDVFPILDLENLTPENFLPAGWTPFFGFINVVGVAAQLAGASLINPADSGNIIVVDKIWVQRETAGQFNVGTTLPLFTLAAGTTTRDTRAANAVGAARLGANANVGAAESGLRINEVAGVFREVELPHGIAVLAPGTQLAVVSETVNDNLSVSFSGRVRSAESSELSF